MTFPFGSLTDQQKEDSQIIVDKPLFYAKVLFDIDNCMLNSKLLDDDLIKIFANPKTKNPRGDEYYSIAIETKKGLYALTYQSSIMY